MHHNVTLKKNEENQSHQRKQPCIKFVIPSDWCLLGQSSICFWIPNSVFAFQRIPRCCTLLSSSSLHAHNRNRQSCTACCTSSCAHVCEHISATSGRSPIWTNENRDQRKMIANTLTFLNNHDWLFQRGNQDNDDALMVTRGVRKKRRAAHGSHQSSTDNPTDHRHAKLHNPSGHPPCHGKEFEF